mmetsp:Transcript_42559/g.102543  ORF Transcript_42559/g.102543 Transcript_42559/m.102543 type:complete len:3788 (-) Transcript_42559:229-11592(-)
MAANGSAPITATGSMPSLFRMASSNQLKMVFQFGGQAIPYFAELQKLLKENPGVRPLFDRAAADLSKLGGADEVHTELPRGLDVHVWVDGTAPAAAYLARTPVSYPLSGLTQMLMYYAALKRSGVEPQQAKSSCGGAIGHSSGICAAVVAAVATSWDHLEELICDMVRYLFWHGVRCQRETPSMIADPDLKKSGDSPTPMLSVRGLTVPVLEQAIASYNESYDTTDSRNFNKAVRIGLINGPENCVVVGYAEALNAFSAGLKRQLPPAEDSQGRVPFSKRKHSYVLDFLDVTAPFHSPVLAAAIPMILEDAKRGSPLIWNLKGSDLAFPVYSTVDGSDLRNASGSLLEKLVDMQAHQLLDWNKTTASIGGEPTVVVDFGPGGTRGTAAFTRKNLAGRKVSFVFASPDGKSSATYPDVAPLVDPTASLSVPSSWEEEFGPRLALVGSDKVPTINNRLTRLLGTPPIIVPGMTPWSHYEQVGAVNQAGYPCELAGGGIPLPHLFEKEIRDLAEIIPSGLGISCNLLFLNPYLWGFQFPQIEQLCAKGEPIDSVTVAAGVPGTEKTREIVASCKRSGMRYICFKPGSADAIEQVLALARENPDFYMVIQWTGGRAGGHHSFEDQFQPLLATYAKIRQCPNVMLIVGGGLGDADSCWEWLSGEWSIPFGRPKMPADGVLMGSRVMAAKESRTCEDAKDLIVAAKGVDNQSDWEQSYEGDAGGVITVLSELGEPIHVINNRAARCWREFDNKYFTKPGGGLTSPQEMVDALEADKANVIKALNNDYQKPWFGKKKDGTPCDIGEMTYEEVAVRLVEVHWYAGNMKGRPQPRWFDVSFRERLFDWMRRTEERFCEKSKKAVISTAAQLEEEPLKVVNKFFEQYPKARDSLLLAADVDYFISSICGIPTRKPINFVPEININFKRYYKGDSLWFSEVIEAVPEFDAQRAFIIHGPLAAKYTTKKDETVAEILNGVRDGMIAKLKAKTPDPECLRELPEESTNPPKGAGQNTFADAGVSFATDGDTVTLELGSTAPDFDTWVRLLTGVDFSVAVRSGVAVAADGVWSGARWLRSLLTASRLQRGDRRAPSFVPRILSAVAHGKVTMKLSEADILECHFFLPGMVSESVSLRYFPNTDDIHMTCTYHAPGDAGSFPLELNFQYKPQFRGAPIHELLNGRNDRIRAFYTQIWVDKDAAPASPTRGMKSVPSSSGIHAVSSTGVLEVKSVPGQVPQGYYQEKQSFEAEHVRRFCREVGQDFETYVGSAELPALPIDFAIVVGWKAMIKSMLNDPRIGSLDFLRLLHLENRFKLVQPRKMKSSSDEFESVFRLVEVENTPTGARVVSRGTVNHDGKPWVILTSSFFVPWDVTATADAEAAKSVEMTVNSRSFVLKLEDEALRSVVVAKPFFEFTKQPTVGGYVAVEIISYDVVNKDGSKNCEAFGSIFDGLGSAREKIGTVKYQAMSVKANALVSFLDRSATEYPKYLDIKGYEMLKNVDEVDAPLKMDRYSLISADINPIHTDQYFARLAGHQQPIVHGMWLSANARRVVGTHVARRETCATMSFKCSFVDKVMPGEKLRTSLRHIGMRDGLLEVAFETVDSKGVVVCAGHADVAQPKVAVTFTGQGAQRPGMGMDLYETSAVAKDLWDQSEAHFLYNYGLSLLEIIRENPKQKTVHFGGVSGARIRAFYMSLVRSSSDGGTAPLFPEITKASTSFTFTSDKGLLYMTQFTQPALMLVELAQYKDLSEGLYLPPDVFFAGHSLGEYAAVAAVADAFTLPDLLDLIFLRGMTMQSVVPRDAAARSDYGMVAVDPTRVKKDFDVRALEDACAAVQGASEGLVQIVNYNVEPTQYVVAGDLTSLTALMHLCNAIKAGKAASSLEVSARGALEQAVQDKAKAGTLTLVRGAATIPLDGIDVPFHSALLRSEVPYFRSVLQKKLVAERVNVAYFENRYIPNLVAKPFKLTTGFVEYVQKVAQSPVLGELLPKWDAYVAADRAQAATTLIIELLAYQFASPVQWTETLDVLMRKAGVRRVCELGPAPVLKGMLQRTLASNSKFFALHGKVDNYCYAMDASKMYFRLPDQGLSAKQVVDAEKAANAPVEEVEEVAAPAPVAAAPVAAAPAPKAAPAPAGDGTEVNALPSALDALRVILGQRFSQAPDALDPAATIKKLSGGKSALQNEVVGDLSKEFPDADLEGAADIPLSQLAAAAQPGYKKLGKLTTELLAQMCTAKLPAGTSGSKVRQAFKDEWMLGTEGIEGALVAGLVLEPAARASDGGAREWRAAAAARYGEYAGKTVGGRGGGDSGSGAAAAGGAVVGVDPKMAAKLNQMVSDLASVYVEYLGEDPRAEAKAKEMEQGLRAEVEGKLAAVTKEFGDTLISGVKPLFESDRAREYSAWWALARRDAMVIWGKWQAQEECSALVDRLKNRMTAEVQSLLRWLATRSEPAVREKLLQLAANPISGSGIYRENSACSAPHTDVKADGTIDYQEVERVGQPNMGAYVENMAAAASDAKKRYLSMRVGVPQSEVCGETVYDDPTTKAYFSGLRDIVTNGMSFQGKVALLTGASPGSITDPVARALLAGGCTVICLTRFSSGGYEWHRQLYDTSAGAGGRLICLPFNQGSKSDVDDVLEHIYGTLGLDVDFCFPFAALSENGRGLDGIDSKSELAHRIMLTNVLRMVGKIKACKEQRRIVGKTCVVVVPLSPNQGVFGFDGLYAESKLGLESLFMKWSSEGLQDHIAVVGAVIGWTRGTALMSANNQVSMGIEALGCRTFTAAEMSFNLMGLLHPALVSEAQLRPLHAQLTGGMQAVDAIADRTAGIRADLALQSRVKKALKEDKSTDKAVETFGSTKRAQAAEGAATVKPRAVPGKRELFPSLPSEQKRQSMGLQGMVDPSKVVVIAGFGELGPYGNSTTRWEMEADGEFSIEGCIEMAWMMGYVKYFNGRMTGADGRPMIYSGWVDSKTGEPLADWDIKAQFEKDILAHTGIRVLEPELFWGYDPKAGAPFYHCVLLERDMPPVEVADEETANEFKKMHGEACEAFIKEDTWYIQLKAGGKIYVPRALRRDRWVVGQIPTGWDAKTYGIPDDVINQVDRVTLFTIVAFVESLVSAGVTDPFEFYKYVHVSKVGNGIGSGIGGMHALRLMFLERKMGDAPRVQGDILQETFINTTAAWINMLFLSSAGPIKTPVGACATALESFAVGYETIVSGQAKVMVCGAFDDLNEESSLEFANMKATTSADVESGKGRPANEMCRPMTSTRAGFMESQGAGVHILMSGDLAIEMGAPIYAVVGLVHTATDREGRSVPAPGKGVLTIAAEGASARFSPLLNMRYRQKQLEAELESVEEWRANAIAALQTEQSVADGAASKGLQASGEIPVASPEAAMRQQALEEEYTRLVGSAQQRWGTEWWKGHTSISPLRGALATWGLTIDDIGICSCHGTSTKLNDKNESDILNTQMETLGRRSGNPLFVVTQKWLTGHPKGPAAAWQLGGVVQAMLAGRVPGNRNLDNVDAEMRNFKHLLYTDKTLDVGQINAAVVTSFGFGQAGGEVLVVHPDFFLSTLTPEAYRAYTAKRGDRCRAAHKYHEDVTAGRRSYVPIKDAAPYPSEEVKTWMLNSDKRVGGGVASVSAQAPSGAESFEFVAPTRRPVPSAVDQAVLTKLQDSLVAAAPKGDFRAGVGVDVESTGNPCFAKPDFIQRNYTAREREQCTSTSSGNPARAFAGTWAGKEAVVKVLGNAGARLRGAGAALDEIELVRADDGSVKVELAGYAAQEAGRVGVTGVQVSLTYAEHLAVAAAVASR